MWKFLFEAFIFVLQKYCTFDLYIELVLVLQRPLEICKSNLLILKHNKRIGNKRFNQANYG